MQVIVQTLFSMQLMGGQSVVTIPPARSCFAVQEALLTVQGTLECMLVTLKQRAPLHTQPVALFVDLGSHVRCKVQGQQSPLP